MIKSHISFLIISILLTSWQPNSFALGRRNIDCDAAKKGFAVSVAGGIGVDLKLACGGNIADIQLSDQSRFIVRKRGPQQLYVRLIRKLNFPGTTSSSDGSAMLSVVTETGEIFQFELRAGGAGYSLLDINDQHESRKPLPIADNTNMGRSPERRASLPPLDQPTMPILPPPPSEDIPQIINPTQPPSEKVPEQKEENKSNSPILFSSSNPKGSEPAQERVKSIPLRDKTSSIAIANSLRKGLNTARLEKKVGYQSFLWMRVQDTIYLLQKGKSLKIATSRSRVSEKMVNSIISCKPKSCKLEK